MLLKLAATPNSYWQDIVALLESTGWQPVYGSDTEIWYQTGLEVPDESNRYLLLHCRPEIAVARATTAGFAPGEALNQWLIAAHAMVSFFKQNRSQAVMVDLAHLQAEPATMLRAISEHLQLDTIADTGAQALITPELPTLELLLANQLVRQTPNIDVLLAQVEACSLLLDGRVYAAPQVDIAAVLAGLRKYDEISAETSRLRQEKDQLTQKVAELERKLQETTSESDLILEQLHRIQEELERQLIQKKELERRLIQKKQLEKQLVEHRQRQEHALEAANREIKRLKNQLNQLQSSTSWKAMAPIRAVGKTFRRGGSQHRSIRRQAELIRRSGLFDEKWYLETYPDIAKAGFDPIEHYLKFGAMEGRNPSPNFNTAWYLSSYPDVVGEDMNPLIHYIKFGRAEKRNPKPNNYRVLPNPTTNG